MEILAIIIFAVIILAIIVIARTYHWLQAQKEVYSPIVPIPEVIIRTYNLHTIKDGFCYSNNLDHSMRYPMHGGGNYMRQDRVDHEKIRLAERLGRHLLENKFIEVCEREDRNNPYINNVQFLLRVYKDACVEQSMPNVQDDDYLLGIM